jgi:hypothetical protein
MFPPETTSTQPTSHTFRIIHARCTLMLLKSTDETLLNHIWQWAKGLSETRADCNNPKLVITYSLLKITVTQCTEFSLCEYTQQWAHIWTQSQRMTATNCLI